MATMGFFVKRFLSWGAKDPAAVRAAVDEFEAKGARQYVLVFPRKKAGAGLEMDGVNNGQIQYSAGGFPKSALTGILVGFGIEGWPRKDLS